MDAPSEGSVRGVSEDEGSMTARLQRAAAHGSISGRVRGRLGANRYVARRVVGEKRSRRAPADAPPQVHERGREARCRYRFCRGLIPEREPRIGTCLPAFDHHLFPRF